MIVMERATLLEARRHLEHQLRVLQAEELALLRWKPGMPLPTPDPLPKEEEADASAGEEAFPDDTRMDEAQASHIALDAPPTDADWEDQFIGEFEKDSPWLAETPPHVFRMG